MKHPISLIFYLLSLLSLTGCHDVPDYADPADPHDPYVNFDALADIVGDHYCYFREKGVDWPELCREHRARITPETRQTDLFFILSDLLDNLRDGHVNLVSDFSTSYYKKWWTDYPQDFNERTLQQYYLDFGGLQTSGITYTMFTPDSIGYMRYPSFSSYISETRLDYILAILQKSHGLIIDIRDNGGGTLTNVPTLVSRFIDHKITGGYIRHKTGPGQEDFSQPYPVDYDPCGSDRVSYLGRPILVLTNRSCYSAANDFVSVMKELPNVRIVGARTGGGGGMPFTSELPNGWAIRFSACPMTDAHGVSTESGIDPTPGCEVHCTPEQLAAGTDAILDFALSLLKSRVKSQESRVKSQEST